MPLRIVSRAAGGQNSLGLEGWLAGPEVSEFERVASALAVPFLIDVSQLAGADALGVAALRAQQARGAQLANASPYVELLLRSYVAAADDECHDRER
jgi:hypothetical protein